MACLLFTYHAHGTWLPDRTEGFVHWREGLQPTDKSLAEAYRKKMRTEPVSFCSELQKRLIDELQTASGFQKVRLHAAATEETHVHAVVSWADARAVDNVGGGLRESLSRRLSKERGKRTWLAKAGSKRRVKNQEHFDYLRLVYLPSHRGWKWDEERGLYL
jgi:hypothetical protein